MFNDIVYENDVEESVFLERIGFKEVRAGKLPFRFECGEKFPGIVNLACCEIQSGDLASCLRERQEISAFAASDFQDYTAGANVLVRFQIINVEFFRRLRQFIEISLFCLCVYSAFYSSYSSLMYSPGVLPVDNLKNLVKNEWFWKPRVSDTSFIEYLPEIKRLLASRRTYSLISSSGL